MATSCDLWGLIPDGTTQHAETIDDSDAGARRGVCGARDLAQGSRGPRRVFADALLNQSPTPVRSD
jgi:hypothetical protein